MTKEQKILALQVGAQLSGVRRSLQAQVKQTIERSVTPVLTKGATRNGVTVSAEDIKAAVGDDVWAAINADVTALEAFAG